MLCAYRFTRDFFLSQRKRAYSAICFGFYSRTKSPQAGIAQTGQNFTFGTALRRSATIIDLYQIATISALCE